MMTISDRKTHPIAGTFVFLLLGIFAIFSTLMVAMSAKMYRQTIAKSDTHNEQRIVDNYFMNTIHAADRSGMISVSERNGIQTLVLTWPIDEQDDEEAAEDTEDSWADEEDEEAEEAESSSYETLIYCWDGTLYELLQSNDSEFVPGDGEAIAQLTGVSFELNDNLLAITVSEEQRETHTLHIKLYTAPGGEAVQ